MTVTVTSSLIQTQFRPRTITSLSVTTITTTASSSPARGSYSHMINILPQRRTCQSDFHGHRAAVLTTSLLRATIGKNSTTAHYEDNASRQNNSVESRVAKGDKKSKHTCCACDIVSAALFILRLHFQQQSCQATLRRLVICNRLNCGDQTFLIRLFRACWGLRRSCLHHPYQFDEKPVLHEFIDVCHLYP